MPHRAAAGRRRATAGGALSYTADFRAESRARRMPRGHRRHHLQRSEPRAGAASSRPDLVSGARAGRRDRAGDRGGHDQPPRFPARRWRRRTPPTSPIDWTPTEWRQHIFQAESVDPTFGTGPISGTPSGLAALTRSGVLLRGTTSAQDILGFTARDRHDLAVPLAGPSRRQHPDSLRVRGRIPRHHLEAHGGRLRRRRRPALDAQPARSGAGPAGPRVGHRGGAGESRR